AVGSGLNALRSAIRSNSSGLRSNVRFDSPRFQSSIVGAAETMAPDSDDPAYQLADDALREARAEAKSILGSISADRIGLVLSTTKANIEALERISTNRPCSESA